MSKYEAIRQDNITRYGTDIGRIGPMLLADRYDDRTHFIFELLQNAEDALARRPASHASRAVRFDLSGSQLRVSHWGKPFDEADVRGVCGIGETTKDLTAIGRFGIGFKSVYAFTSRPEVHSGTEAFAIENFVWPVATAPIDRRADETVIVLPLNSGDESAQEEILVGLRQLGAGTLLFLRQIEEIEWKVADGPSGLYLRSQPEAIGDNARRITVIGQEEGKPDTEETWIVFAREAKADNGEVVGFTEIAFAVGDSSESGKWSVVPASDSPLVVFFPTVVQTNLGFLVQGPYRTTPSRDNVPRNDPWNQHLVRDTAALLVEALRWLRDQGFLDTSTLRCLPLNSSRFSEGSMFAPIFEATRKAFQSEPLLPRFGGGYVAAARAKLARTQELRQLLGNDQLAAIQGQSDELAWLTGDITQDRTPDVRQYVVHELGVSEITPETLLPKLKKSFLETQSDEWIVRLYEFLNGQSALRRRLDDLPLVRLSDGTQTTARENGQPSAFLPGSVETDFPTVSATVCATPSAREFLESLGLTEPDPVDDVIWNVLPKYHGEEVDVDDSDYEADIRRIVRAFRTDSKSQREKLLSALRDTSIVMCIDTGDSSKWISKPTEVYIATDRLKALFAGVPGVMLVDVSYSCLRGEEIRDLLEACGTARYLQLERTDADFSWEELREMRISAGCEDSTWSAPIEDYTLRGLTELLTVLPTLDPQSQERKAALLWEAVGDVADRRGTGSFTGTYAWTYYHRRSTLFDAAFVRTLNKVAWVPDGNGALHAPAYVPFASLNWKSNPFLQSKIRFKPPIIETLAKEAGIDPGVLDLLKKLGVTSVGELQSRLGLDAENETEDSKGCDESVEDALKKPGTMPEQNGRGSSDGSGAGPSDGGPVSGERSGTRAGAGSSTTSGSQGETGSTGRFPGSKGGRPFISYLGAHPKDEEPDPDGLSHDARMALETKAIELILTCEPGLERTPVGNRGFDLFEPGDYGQPVRWIEVKAMTGCLHDRPVGMSHPQFECAAVHGDAFWLYVVEHANSPDARIVRIQDPARRARTFTFDHGWLNVADRTDYRPEDGHSE